MKIKVFILLLMAMISNIAIGRPLAEKFQAFKSMPGVSTYQMESLVPWHEGCYYDALSTYATPSLEMILYKDSFNKFIQSLPVKYRLSKTGDADPLIYFYQPTTTKPAEVLFMMSDDDGKMSVTFFRLKPSEGVKFKKIRPVQNINLSQNKRRLTQSSGLFLYLGERKMKSRD